MGPSPSPRTLKVIIVGAGLSGLTAAARLAQLGHTVHVLEREPAISPRGGGIVFFPNVIRIFESWGLTGAFAPIVDVLERTVVRRHGDEKVLRRIYREEEKGYAGSWYVRRADAQKALYDAAAQLGVQFLFSARIASIHQSNPSITLDSGSMLHADLIIGADGHASLIRDSISPCPTPEKRTGVVFQVSIPYPLPTTLPIALPSHSSADKAFLFFVGPGRYAIAWPAKAYLDIQLGDEEYPHPSIPNAAQLSDMEYLRQRFADFSPTLSALLSTVEDTHRWRIAFLPPLDSWRSPSGRIVLIGDAAHAMGPYAGQGAGQGIEDAAVLSELLHPSIRAEDISRMTELYQALRKPRAEKVQGIAWKYREHFTVGDGPVQRRRDELLRRLEEGGTEGQSRDEAWLEGYDAVGEARGLLRRVRGQGQGGVVVEAKL